jgi:hypothetical protein
MTGYHSGPCLEGLVDAPLGVAHPNLDSVCAGGFSPLVRIAGVFGTYMNWWLQCKDRKSWTIAIHKLKQTTDVEREQFGL